MKKILYPILAVTLFAGTAFTIMKIQSWMLAKDCLVKFSSPQVEGVFEKMSADILFDSSNLNASRISAIVEASSVNTGIDMQSEHARGSGYLEADKFPKITFNSTQIGKATSGYNVKGQLELHGAKKEIAFPFSFKANTFEGSFKISARAYGITGLDEGASDTIKLELKIPVSKK